MNYKIILYLLLGFLFYSCDISSTKKASNTIHIPVNNYKNSGFALVYNNELNEVKKLEDRSLSIYHKSLKKRSKVKILNPVNNKYLIAEVKSNKVKFSNFYNSILSSRIAEELELNLNEPYIEIISISKDSTFISSLDIKETVSFLIKLILRLIKIDKMK